MYSESPTTRHNMSIIEGLCLRWWPIPTICPVVLYVPEGHGLILGT